MSRSIGFLATSVIAAAALLLLTSTATTPVTAWWCTGHMLVAQIAKDHLLSLGAEGEKTVAITEYYFKKLSEWGPFPQAPDMVNGACLADDVKTLGVEAMSPWHFINTPFDPSNFTYKNEGCPMMNDNVAAMINSLGKSAREGAEKQNPWVASLGLMYTIHLSGDVAQPLHCTELYSERYPTGDRGGNDIKVWVNGSFTKMNLHGAWDSVCDSWTTELPQPISGADKEFIENTAKQLVIDFPISKESAEIYDPYVMANESYQLAKKYAYYYPNGTMVQYGDVLGNDYFNACLPIAKRQLVRAGLRLGNQLKFLLKDAHLPATSTPMAPPGPGPHSNPAAPTQTCPTMPVATTTTQAPGGNNNNDGGAPADESDKWNSSATGAFIGGIFLGAGLVVIGYLVHKHFIAKQRNDAIPSTPHGSGLQSGYGAAEGGQV